MGTFRGASQGQGFSFSTQLIELAILAIKSTFTIVGANANAAPIQSLFIDNFLIRGDIMFTPDADTEYTVKGVLGAEFSAVWIENNESGEIIKNKVGDYFCKMNLTNASNLIPQVGRFFAKHTAQKSVQHAPLFMRSVRRMPYI